MDPPEHVDEDAVKACVTAALRELNSTMARHAEAQIAMANAAQAQIGTLVEMGSELRSCVKIVEVCIDAFVRRKTPADEAVQENVEEPVGPGRKPTPSADPSHNVIVVDLSSGTTSENTTTPRDNAELGPKFPPGLIFQWLDDTIMLTPVVPTKGLSDPFPDPPTTESLCVPPAVGGKMKARLGTLPDGLGSVSSVRTRAGTKGKMTEQSPEEAKRSGKMRRAPRETTMDLYGYKKVGVVFPTVSCLTFAILCNVHVEAQVIAYMFNDRRNSAEVLFKRDTEKMDREDFATLLPGNEPSDYIMELMAYRTSWTQRQI
ncbi:hypothetical protein PIB30_049469 [Stylosanthes scabra]|uniref:Uncharacterized protein n=1 Tax=Stylosanthes scabra TaxID=79078 RepID=A0ABU6YHJ9_9FABA|nr:hypothetical protein [Stylosanthes scabra]